MIDRYREWYEHEKAMNRLMIDMIESVPIKKRCDPKFPRAVILAEHLASCRENWLDRMDSHGDNQTDWFVASYELSELRPRFEGMERKWTEYLSRLTNEDLEKTFSFRAGNDSVISFKIEIQIMQLIGHAFYHRGQIAVLVDELGGKAVDTDFLFWAIKRP